MRSLIVCAAATCPLTFPATAQYTAPKYDEDGCEELGSRIDRAEQAKQQPAGDDAEQFDLCIRFLGCEKTEEAADKNTVPKEALQLPALFLAPFIGVAWPLVLVARLLGWL